MNVIIIIIIISSSSINDITSCSDDVDFAELQLHRLNVVNHSDADVTTGKSSTTSDELRICQDEFFGHYIT